MTFPLTCTPARMISGNPWVIFSLLKSFPGNLLLLESRLKSGLKKLFMFGCTGSSLLLLRLSLIVASRVYSLWCTGFPLQWLLLFWSTGFRLVGVNSWSTRAQRLWCMDLVALRHVTSSWTRDWTRVPCIGRQILMYCTTREVQTFIWLTWPWIAYLPYLYSLSLATLTNAWLRVGAQFIFVGEMKWNTFVGEMLESDPNLNTWSTVCKLCDWATVSPSSKCK